MLDFDPSITERALLWSVVLLALCVATAVVLLVRRRRRSQLPAPPPRGAHPSTRVVIFFSSIGYGHISAARAIRDTILLQDAEARVVLQDIREFMHPLWRRIDERLYWLVAGNLPETFDLMFREMQARGNRVPSLAQLPNQYPDAKVLDFLQREAADVVLATHYGSAQVLGNLRERGLLTDMRIGWLHTDFFEGYFPRISKRLDCTFLAHPELEAIWRAAGVPAAKTTTSGMPVAISDAQLMPVDEVLRTLGFSAQAPTVLLVFGKEGVGDYAGLIDGLARKIGGALQIIAICGTNARQRARLEALRQRLRREVLLKVTGVAPHTELLSWMRAADVIITKAGGLTPAEAFTLGTPTVLLDVVGGHERDNASLFVRLGVAALADDAEHAAGLTCELLLDPNRVAAMRHAQRQFRESANIGKIARFALDDAFAPVAATADFGVAAGTPALNIDEALARLNQAAPGEVELLLSDATSQTPQRIVTANPFGHLAIRVDDVVYSANYVATPDSDTHLLQHLSLADYLYGVRPPPGSQIHTHTFGLSYGRETLGLRLAGISAERRAAMVAEAQRIEDEFTRGTLHWDRSEFNCADVVDRMLHAAGCAGPSLADRLGVPAMPLDSFERAQRCFEGDPAVHVELVAYRLLPGTQAPYRFSRFPLSLRQPLRSAKRLLEERSRDPLQDAVTRQLTGYLGDQSLYFEDLRRERGAGGTDVEQPAHFGRMQHSLAQALATDLRRRLATDARLAARDLENAGELYGAREIRRLLDRTLDLARIATEQAESVLSADRAQRLRAQFRELLEDYGGVDGWRPQAPKVTQYLERFQAFEVAMTREFSAHRFARFWRWLRRWWYRRGSWRRPAATTRPGA